MTEKKIQKLLSQALHNLYLLEDLTYYENKKISKAINLLQKVDIEADVLSGLIPVQTIKGMKKKLKGGVRENEM